MRVTGLFENIFKKQQKEKAVQGYFETFSAYTPSFTSFEGSVYEMELTRAAIHAFATHCSKFKPEIKGPGNTAAERRLQFRPNPYMDTAKFLYRLATIYQVRNNAFIAPILADDLETITGYYPLLPSRCEIREYHGEPYLRYLFNNGQAGAIELSRAGILTQHQYKDDFFGESNAAFDPTLQIISTQRQGIIEGVKNSASIRFIGRLGQALKDKTIEEERRRFVASNLSAENNGGLLLADAKYADIKQVESNPNIVNPAQMKLIQENVYNYFGVNESILQNKFTEDEWNAFYEGKLEPFAIQLSLVMTNMTFSGHELAFGNQILFTANRLQYASNSTKLNVVTQLFDRGFLTHNQGLEIFNMAGIGAQGDKYFIRREYAEVSKLKGEEDDAVQTTGAGIPGDAAHGDGAGKAAGE